MRTIGVAIMSHGRTPSISDTPTVSKVRAASGTITTLSTTLSADLMKTPRRPPARRRGRKNQPATVLVFVLLAAILTLWQSIKDDDAPADHAAAPGVTQPILGEPGSALATVDELTVKGRAPRTGYARDNFGAGWNDPAGIGRSEERR